MPKKFRQITNTVILASDSNDSTYKGIGTLLDLMENDVILRIFEFLPKNDIFWNIAYTCRQLFELSCSYVNVIEFPLIPLRHENKEGKKIYEDYINQITEEPFIAESIKSIVVCQEKDKHDIIEEFGKNSGYESKTIVFCQEDLYKMPWFGRSFILLTTKCLYTERLHLIDNLGEEILKHVLTEGAKYIAILDITGSRITDNGLKKVTDCLSKGGPFDGRKHLVSLTMNCNALTDRGLKVIASNCLDLKELFLNNCLHLTSDGFKDVAAGCTELQTLQLRYAKRFKNEDVHTLAEQFNSVDRMINKTRLKNLSLSMCRSISDEGVLSIGYHLRYLISLDLCGMWEVSDVGIQSVVENCRNLQTLDISGCWELTDKGIKFVAENCSKLERLNVSGCGCISDIGIILVATDCKQLKQLGLSACIGITNKGFNGIADQCDNLLDLDLSGSHNLTDDGANYVVEHSNALKFLDLRKCDKLSDECISNLRKNKQGLRVLFSRTNIELIPSNDKKIEKMKPKCVQPKISINNLKIQKFNKRIQVFRKK